MIDICGARLCGAHVRMQAHASTCGGSINNQWLVLMLIPNQSIANQIAAAACRTLFGM